MSTISWLRVKNLFCILNLLFTKDQRETGIFSAAKQIPNPRDSKIHLEKWKTALDVSPDVSLDVFQDAHTLLHQFILSQLLRQETLLSLVNPQEVQLVHSSEEHFQSL